MSPPKIIAALLAATGIVIAYPDTPPKPDDALTNRVDQALNRLVTQRRADFIKPKLVRFFLISPSPYSDAEYAKARDAGTEAETFRIGGRAHKVFKELTLTSADATRFGRCFYDDLTYAESHEGIRLVSFCLFQPMHAFEFTFDDGTKWEGAICVHCGDLMFKLPRSGMEEYRGVQTKELTNLTTRILPIPRELEQRFFPKK